MKFYRLQMPKTWEPDEDDTTLYREHDNGYLEVLNYNDEWQASALSSVADLRSFYTHDPDRAPWDRWTLTEITESEVPQ